MEINVYKIHFHKKKQMETVWCKSMNVAEIFAIIYAYIRIKKIYFIEQFSNDIFRILVNLHMSDWTKKPYLTIIVFSSYA